MAPGFPPPRIGGLQTGTLERGVMVAQAGVCNMDMCPAHQDWDADE